MSSIWGKILGGVAGFALGGPLGALLGALGGHAIDKLREDGGGHPHVADQTKSVAFTIAVIVLGAKMAKADGHVTQEEIRAFKEVFKVPPEELDNVARVFNQAKRDSAGFEVYARQIAGMFRDSPAMLEEMLWCLAHIARADGMVHPAEAHFLHRVAEIFGLDEAAFERVTAIRDAAGPGDADPYKVLGVARTADNDMIKAAHRSLVRENHPDRLIAQGMPEEFVATANQKLAAINAAWDRIKTERGII